MSVRVPTGVRVVLRCSLLAVTALGALACGGDGTGPRGAGFTVIAGGGTSDTISAKQVQPLVVAVRGPDGRAAPAGVLVHFFVRPPVDKLRRDERGVAVCVLTDPACAPASPERRYGTALDALTDDRGQVRAQIAFSTVAGGVYVIMLADDYGTVDSVAYTVRPGAPARVRFTTGDTVVYVGGRAVVRAITADRFGNARPEAPTLSRASTAVTVDAAGLVTGVANGLGLVVARYGSAADTIIVGVPPNGRVAAWSEGAYVGVLTVDLDGSYRRETILTHGPHGFPALSADRKTLLFVDRDAVGNTGLFALDSNGRGGREIAWGQVGGGQFSRDGAYAFYSTAWDVPTLWRVRLDGSDSASLYRRPAFSNGTFRVSPDGARALFVDGSLTLATLATGAATRLATQGAASYARWAPDGASIAYGGAGVPIRAIDADGTNDRVLVASDAYTDFDFSPDGRWIIAARVTTGELEVVRLADGLAIRLPFGSPFHEPSWR